MSAYQFGWKSMAEYAGCCPRTLMRIREDLKAEGVIDYPLKGRPPKRVMRWKADLFDDFRKKNNKP